VTGESDRKKRSKQLLASRSQHISVGKRGKKKKPPAPKKKERKAVPSQEGGRSLALYLSTRVPPFAAKRWSKKKGGILFSKEE